MLDALNKKGKFVLLALAAGLVPIAPGLAATGEDPKPQEANLEAARGIVKGFFSDLKAELQAAINQGGPVDAIGVCKERASAIAAEHSAKTGWDVGRTSLKLRNPANAPDDWERQVLRKFEERKANGEDIKTMTFAAVTQEDGKRRFRFMQAIPTGELCLTCHGEALPEEITTILDELYLQDQARGFSRGDIRGAFTLSRPL